jgi:hypothetical protein
MNLSLKGLTAAPSQVHGAIRLVPLLRQRPCYNLRFGLEHYSQPWAQVKLDDKLSYYSFIPHGLVLNYDASGYPAASFGGQLQKINTQGKGKPWYSLAVHDKLVKRRERSKGSTAIRLLPLHLAMEGFLAYAFAGPSIAWPNLSRRIKGGSLVVRSEYSVSGAGISGLADALRVFELHEGQVGVLLFVADAFASAFVLPNPADYRLLHQTLLEDFYGETLAYYAALSHPLPELDIRPNTAGAQSFSDLRLALAEARVRWNDLTQSILAQEIVDRPLLAQKRAYKLGPFCLEQIITELDLQANNHIGERLLGDDGEVLYLKTYQLSNVQTRRAMLLKTLSDNFWDLDNAAKAIHIGKNELIRRLDRAGFGHFVHGDDLYRAKNEYC